MRKFLATIGVLASFLVGFQMSRAAAPAGSYLYWRKVELGGNSSACTASVTHILGPLGYRKPSREGEDFIFGQARVSVICTGSDASSTALVMAAGDGNDETSAAAAAITEAIRTGTAPAQPRPIPPKTQLAWRLTPIVDGSLTDCYEKADEALRHEGYRLTNSNNVEVAGFSPANNYVSITCTAPASKQAVMVIGHDRKSISDDLAHLIGALGRPTLLADAKASQDRRTGDSPRHDQYAQASAPGSERRAPYVPPLDTRSAVSSASTDAHLSWRKVELGGSSKACPATVARILGPLGYGKSQSENTDLIFGRARVAVLCTGSSDNAVALVAAAGDSRDETSAAAAVIAEAVKTGSAPAALSRPIPPKTQFDWHMGLLGNGSRMDCHDKADEALHYAQYRLTNSNDLEVAGFSPANNYVSLTCVGGAYSSVIAIMIVGRDSKSLADDVAHLDDALSRPTLLLDTKAHSEVGAVGLARQGRFAEASDLFGPSLIDMENDDARHDPHHYRRDLNRLVPEHYAHAGQWQMLAGWDIRAGRDERAANELRLACTGLHIRAAADVLPLRPGETYGDVETPPTSFSECERQLAFESWVANEKGAKSHDWKDVAFEAAQGAIQSEAGDSVSLATARLVAQHDGAGAILKNLDDVNRTYRRAVEVHQAAMAETRSAEWATRVQNAEAVLARERGTYFQRVTDLLEQLQTAAPDYVEIRAAVALSIDDLQSNPKLLLPNEVLVQVFVPPGSAHGFVFAISHEKSAWARIALSGDELRQSVESLRAQLESNNPGDPSAFRATALEIYNAIFGNREIAAIVQDGSKPVLVFVPSGPLVALPIGLLVTSGPPHGRPWAEPAATNWLLKSKAIAVLPSVASLRMLRLDAKQYEAGFSNRLLAIADPDYHGDGNAGEAQCDVAMPEKRGLPPESVFKAGDTISALKKFDLLPCSRVEAEQLQKAIGTPSRVLRGADASKSELMAWNNDGRLAGTEILAFATHAFTAGDFRGAAEPGLALAAPKAGTSRVTDNGVLVASDVAILNLHTQWVLLSGCNTAVPRGEANGLSALSSAFFHAGAHALLATNWSLSDRVASALVPRMFTLQRQGIARAQALQRASLQLMQTDANPSDWAVFTLIGDPQ